MAIISLQSPGYSRALVATSVADHVLKKKPNIFRAGFAYATLDGVKNLVDTVGSRHWNSLEKIIIAGINHGITEPVALSYLLESKNISLYAFMPERNLTAISLFRGTLFHPKFMLFQNNINDADNFFFAGSHNLTGAAMGPNIKNVECGYFLNLPPGNSLDDFDFWWASILSRSAKVTKKFVEKYAKVRSDILLRNPDILSGLNPADNINRAQSFWIEVGKGSGIQRHQVEFSRELASFFGKPIVRKRGLTLQNDNDTWSERPFSHKKTSYNVDIWRLGMPTINMGGVPIKDRIIKYMRTSDPKVYSFQVTDIASNEAASWFDECNRFGHIGKTSGVHGRRYGYM